MFFMPLFHATRPQRVQQWSTLTKKQKGKKGKFSEPNKNVHKKWRAQNSTHIQLAQYITEKVMPSKEAA